MTTYILTPDGLLDKKTGVLHPKYDPSAPIKGFPRIHTGDEQEATLSMADGKYYTSKAKMRATYKPGGNPQGESFIEVGDDQSYKKIAEQRRNPNPEQIHEAAQRAVADLNAGRLGE
jgi:hypothetical protein